jgi:hypothetical protein
MPKKASDEDFARAFAPLLEVQQRGRLRAATPNDVLEILEVNGGRYVLKGSGGYLAQSRKGWTDRQREAIVISDRVFAHQARRQGLRENGVVVKVVRLRRRGTCGIEAVRMRAGLDVSAKDGTLGIGLSAADAMTMLAALSGGKEESGEQ